MTQRFRIATLLAMCVAVSFTIVIEVNARDFGRSTVIDGATGAALLMSGIWCISAHRYSLAGRCLLLSGLLWLVADTDWWLGPHTAHIHFLHRALLLHAVLAGSTGHRSERFGRLARMTAVALAYVVFIDHRVSTSAAWLTLLAVVVVGVVVGDVASGRATVAAGAGLALGTSGWWFSEVLANRALWFTNDTRFDLMCAATALTAVAVAAGARGVGRRWKAEEDLRIAFRSRPDEPFTTVAGAVLEPSGDHTSTFVDLGELGDALVMHPPRALDGRRTRALLATNLRLLAANHRAAGQARRQADDLAAARRRVIDADAAQMSAELDLLVANRLELALRTMSTNADDESQALVNSLARVLDEVRSLAAGLDPRALKYGLVAAIEHLAAHQPTSISVRVIDHGAAADGHLDSDQARALYFVTAESLTNALRHGQADVITVHLATEASAVVITIQDNGTGRAKVIQGGGLHGAARRLAVLGGNLHVRAEEGKGTTVVARLPLSPHLVGAMTARAVT
jgi:signal transduction histidine kinase